MWATVQPVVGWIPHTSLRDSNTSQEFDPNSAAPIGDSSSLFEDHVRSTPM